MAGSSLGIYFDETRLYVVELHKEFGETQIARSAEADLPAGADAVAIARAARQAVDRAKIPVRTASLALPEREVMLRYFDIPPVPKKELAAAARFEAQKYVPFDVRDLVSDFETMREKGSRRIGVAFVAAKKKFVEDLAAAFEDQDLRLLSLESASLALVRSLTLTPAKNETRALIYRDPPAGLNTVIYRNRSVLMSRSGQPLRPNTLEAAEKSPAELITSEIRLAFNYFSKTFKNEVIKRLVVATDGRDDEAWALSLGREFGLPVQIASTLCAQSKGRALPTGLCAALGAALRGVGGDMKRMNLAPRVRPKAGAGITAASAQLTPEEEKEYFKKWLVREAVAGGLLLLALHIGLSFQTAQIRKSLATERLVPVKTATANSNMSYDELKAKLNDLTAREAFLAKAVDGRTQVTEKLNEVSKHLPDDLKLTSFEYTDFEDRLGNVSLSVRMDGLATGGNELVSTNRFVSALKESDGFRRGLRDVKLTAVKKAVGQTPGYFSVDSTSMDRG